MSYTYLQALGEESSAESFLEIDQSALWSGNPPRAKCYWQDNATDRCPASLSGMMSAPSTESPGAESSMSSAGASHARTSAPPVDGEESKESEADYGRKWRELSVRFDPHGYSWKTHRLLWEEDLPWSSVILPPWGSMQDGVCWELLTPEAITIGNGSGFWPTPNAFRDTGETPCNWKTRSKKKRNENPSLGDLHLSLGIALRSATETSGKQNPTWTEWLMGWPREWSLATKPLETDRFRSWLHTHSSLLRNLCRLARL